MFGLRVLRAGTCFLVWALIDLLRHRIGGQGVSDFLAFLCIVTVVAFVYLVYYIISEKLYDEILGSLVISLVLMGMTAILPILGILLLLWVLYNVVATVQSIVSLIPSALLSGVAFVLLFPMAWGTALGPQVFAILRPLLVVGPSLGDKYEGAVSLLDVGFLGIAAIHSWVISASPLKEALARLALLGGSIGLIILSLCAIIEGVRSVFQTNWVASTSKVKVTQQVSEHVRSGIYVRDYERQVTRSVVSSVVVKSVGSGGLTVGAVGGSMHVVKSTADKPKDEDT
ncbi:hypothetical protein [Rhodanobacter sp. MP7CTX1]|uniref:hypothetical protein n=1 Tax=Rhodanobacter sp. MP7CTX1 TaxID=2723084 RepID=UPI00160E22DD|nr:hypothetical protein [Rhodanobacter sp. MP7CTX1]MBB6187554.1 hypothetical protein [Rhodanobacter sp. MP7CTX1]